jgi:hypothetical protein
LNLGNRYAFSGKVYPGLKEWSEKQAGVDFNIKAERQADMDVKPPVWNHAFIKEVEQLNIFSRRSFDKYERITHSHGEALNESFSLRHGTFDRFIDVVIYPGSNEHCEVGGYEQYFR